MSTEFSAPDVSCQHCVSAITGEVKRLPGVQNVTVDLGSKRVRVAAAAEVGSEHPLCEASWLGRATWTYCRASTLWR